MPFTSIGDLAQGFAMRQQSSVLKQQMERLTQELSSGVTSDVTKKLSGNFATLSDVKHSLTVLQSYQAAADQGRIESQVMQTSLEKFQSEAQGLSNTAITLATSPGAVSFGTFAREAKGALGAMISALNTSVGGRTLFSGAEVSSLAIAQQDDFLTAIQTAISGATSAADINAAMDMFFDTPGGDFDTLIYQGDASPRTTYPLGEGESVTLDLRADDQSIRSILKQVAIAATLDDAGTTLTSADRAELVRQVGETLLAGQDRITNIRADLGFAESRIEMASVRINTEISAFNLTQSDLLAVDPFETASELETVQLRLETLYTLTARTSRLNLVNYLS